MCALSDTEKEWACPTQAPELQPGLWGPRQGRYFTSYRRPKPTHNLCLEVQDFKDE